MKNNLTKLQKMSQAEKELNEAFASVLSDDTESAEEFVASMKVPMMEFAKSAIEMGEESHNKDIAAQLTIARCSSLGIGDDKVWGIYRDFFRRLENEED